MDLSRAKVKQETEYWKKEMDKYETWEDGNDRRKRKEDSMLLVQSVGVKQASNSELDGEVCLHYWALSLERKQSKKNFMCVYTLNMHKGLVFSAKSLIFIFMEIAIKQSGGITEIVHRRQ